jgi:hypothetical protein
MGHGDWDLPADMHDALWLMIASYMRNRPDGLKEMVQGLLYCAGQRCNVNEWPTVLANMVADVEQAVEEFRDVYGVHPPGKPTPSDAEFDEDVPF